MKFVWLAQWLGIVASCLALSSSKLQEVDGKMVEDWLELVDVCYSL